MYLDHPVFETPADSTIIWRYTTWGRFCDILARNALFFARAMTFDDPWESSYPEHQYGPDERWGSIMQFSTEKTRESYLQQERQIRDAFAKSRRTCAVSCWHMSDHESDTHWRIYGHSSESVAIRSTVGHLKRALDVYTDRSLKIGKVKYIDYETARIPTDNGFWPVVHKRLAFVHDREVRAVVWEGEPGLPFGESGVHVAVDVPALVRELVVSPLAHDSFVETVRNVVGRFGGTFEVRRSKLLDRPTYRISE